MHWRYHRDDEIERLTRENKLQWENIQKLLAENERLTQERDEAVADSIEEWEQKEAERDRLRAELERAQHKVGLAEELLRGGK